MFFSLIATTRAIDFLVVVPYVYFTYVSQLCFTRKTGHSDCHQLRPPFFLLLTPDVSPRPPSESIAFFRLMM